MANETIGVDIEGIVRTFLADYVKALSIETSYTDPIIIAEPFKEGPKSVISSAAEEVRPKLVFLFNDGNKMSLAPYGEPDPSKRTRIYWAAGGAVLGVGGLAYLIARKGK